MVTETASLAKAFDPVFSQQTNEAPVQTLKISVTQDCYNNH